MILDQWRFRLSRNVSIRYPANASSISLVDLGHGALTKQGNKWLRWAFIEAVTPAVRSSNFIGDHYRKVKSRQGAKDARCSTARKIAEITYTVRSEQRCWEETRS